MAKCTSITAAEVIKAKQLRDQATKISEYRKALVVILVAECGFVAEKAAEVLGMSRRTVFRDQSDIRSQDGRPSKAWGGRRHAAMTLEEEQEFLALWKEKSAQGGVLTVPPIHAALVERVGRDLPLSTTYRLLARHGWRKVQPDTKHPKNDPAKQDDFKKNSPKNWLPPA